MLEYWDVYPVELEPTGVQLGWNWKPKGLNFILSCYKGGFATNPKHRGGYLGFDEINLRAGQGRRAEAKCEALRGQGEGIRD